MVLQKSQMRTPGSWISRCGCWNRPIVCLHAGRGLGQTVPPFQDFKLKTGKKEGKGGSGLEWLQKNFLSTGSAQLQGKGNALKRERLAVLYELWSRTSIPQHSLPFFKKMCSSWENNDESHWAHWCNQNMYLIHVEEAGELLVAPCTDTNLKDFTSTAKVGERKKWKCLRNKEKGAVKVEETHIYRPMMRLQLF